MDRWRSLMPGSAPPTPEVLDFEAPTLNLTAEIGAARHGASISENYAELDRIVEPEPAHKASERFRVHAQAALAQNHALRICANHALVLQLMQTYRHTLCHPGIPIRKDTDLMPFGQRFDYGSPEQAASDRRGQDFEGTRRIIPEQGVMASETLFRALAANLHIIEVPESLLYSDGGTYKTTSESRIPVWVFGRRPVFRSLRRKPVEFDYLAAAIDSGLPKSLKTYGLWRGGISKDGHHGTTTGGFISIANRSYFDLLRDNGTTPAGTVNALQRHWNTFGLIGFRGPENLPTVGLTDITTTQLQDPDNNTYRSSPKLLAALCEKHRVTPVQLVGRVTLSDQAMIEHEVPSRLQNLATALGIEPQLQDLITTWLKRRQQIDKYTTEDEDSPWSTMPPKWGVPRIPASYDYTLDPNDVWSKYHTDPKPKRRR